MEQLINELTREAIALGRARCQLAAAESGWETPLDNITIARLRIDVEAHETVVDIVQNELYDCYEDRGREYGL